MIYVNVKYITDKQYEVTLITNVGFTLISIASFMSVLLIIWQIGGDLFNMSDISAIFLGFVAILLTLFFVNLDHARRIKAECLAARNLGLVLKNIAVLLREIKEKMDKVEEEHGETTKTNNILEKLLHHGTYLHQHDQLISNSETLGIYYKGMDKDMNIIGFACRLYYKEASPSEVMGAVNESTQVLIKILNLDWYARYGGTGFGNIVGIIIQDMRGLNSYDKPISGTKYSRDENDVNRATPI